MLSVAENEPEVTQPHKVLPYVACSHDLCCLSSEALGSQVVLKTLDPCTDPCTGPLQPLLVQGPLEPGAG